MTHLRGCPALLPDFPSTTFGPLYPGPGLGPHQAPGDLVPASGKFSSTNRSSFLTSKNFYSNLQEPNARVDPENLNRYPAFGLGRIWPAGTLDYEWGERRTVPTAPDIRRAPRATQTLHWEGLGTQENSRDPRNPHQVGIGNHRYGVRC